MSVLLRVVIILAFCVLAVMSIYPWRLKVKQDWELNSYSARMSLEEFHAKKQLNAVKDLPMSDERRLKAMENMADVLARTMKQDDAINMYSEVWKQRELKRRQSTERSEDFCNTMLRTAAVHRDKGTIDDAVSNYETIIWYDKTYPGTDGKMENRLARDLNNLGVIYYMKGLGFPKKTDGLADYQKSVDFFRQAIEKYRALYGADSQYEANALYNEVLPLRELGKASESKMAKAEADRIAAKVKRPCQLP